MSQISILVVDDEKEIADLVEIYLVSDGYRVFKANNAQEGLDILEKEEVHLVLSATTKYADMVNIVDSYSDLDNYKIIFTKLDETASLGNILNLKLYTGAGLSYITCGQNVPDDIEEFNPQKTVKQLLGGKK